MLTLTETGGIANRRDFLKIGSLALYRKYTPLFLGMMVGHTFGIGLGVLVDALLFHGEGHSLNRW